MKLVLTCHGRTVANEQHILEGVLPGELSEEGKRQVELVALRLKEEKIAHSYTSPLKRAADTAKRIAEYHPDTPLDVITDLRENDLGPFEGKPNDSIDWSNPPNTIESRESLDERARNVLNFVRSQHQDQTVLLIGHNAINKALIRVITGDYSDDPKQENTAMNIFYFDEKSLQKIERLNCIEHLDM